MRMLYQSVVVKRELSVKAKLLIYQPMYILTRTNGHELWVVAEIMDTSDGRSSAIRVKCSRQVPPGRSPGTDPGQTKDIIYLGWLG